MQPKAKANEVRTYTATVNTEGASNTLRGKIPSRLIQTLGGEQGDIIEFETTGGFITGGHIVRGRKAEQAVNNAYKPPTQPRAQAVAAPKVKANGGKLKVKQVAQTEAPKVKKIAQPAPKVKQAPKIAPKTPAKVSNRKTKVEYSAPAPGSKGKIKPRLAR